MSGWWLAEKFDGIRAFWDGAALRTRTWRAIAAPAWFTTGLPEGVALDGELWGGRGTFQIASELSRFQRSEDPMWREMKFMVFDAPTTEAVPIEARMRRAAEWVSHSRFGQGSVQRIEMVHQKLCCGAQDAQNLMEEIVRDGGEGCVLRRPGSFYTFGRSVDWLKVKPEGMD